MSPLLLAATFAANAHAAPVTYTLKPEPSALYVVVYGDRSRASVVKAHDHAVSASEFDGTVVWDPDDPSACKVSIAFPVTALKIDPPGYREREGLDPDGAVEEDTKTTIFGNMTKKMNLWIEQYTQIRYEATKCAATEGGVSVTGNLTIRGVSKEVTLPMTTTATADKFTAKGTFELTHADFGMKPFTYGPLTPKNEERLKFVVDVVGKPAG